MSRPGVGGLLAAWLCAALLAVSAAGAQPVKVSPLPSQAGGQDRRDWWLDLSLPPPAAVPAEQRRDQAQRVREQQNQVARQVPALGGQVVGRVSQVRNALAVRIPADRLSELGRLPGVSAVRPVRHAQQPQ